MVGNNGLKLIALAVLLEYVFVKPRIIQRRDDTDFIVFVLVHAVLAYVGRLNTQYLTDKQRSAALANGLLGGVFGYAWLLFHIKHHERQIHHLFVANALILAGIVLRAWYDRRLNSRDGRQLDNAPNHRPDASGGRAGKQPSAAYGMRKSCCPGRPIPGVPAPGNVGMPSPWAFM